MVLLASVAHGVAAVVLGWNRRSRWGCWRLCWCNSRPQCWCRAAAGRDITVAATGLKLWCCWSWLQLELKEEVVLLVGSRCRWERRSSWTGRDAAGLWRTTHGAAKQERHGGSEGGWCCFNAHSTDTSMEVTVVKWALLLEDGLRRCCVGSSWCTLLLVLPQTAELEVVELAAVA